MTRRSKEKARGSAIPAKPQQWHSLSKQKVRVRHVAVRKPLYVTAYTTQTVRNARRFPLAQVLQNIQVAVPGMCRQIAIPGQRLVRLHRRGMGRLRAMAVRVAVDGCEHGGIGPGRLLLAIGHRAGLDGAGTGSLRALVCLAWVVFGHDHTVIDDLGVLALPFLETASMDRVLAVVVGGFGLVVTSLQVFLVVLFNLGDVTVYFLAVWSFKGVSTLCRRVTQSCAAGLTSTRRR